MKKISTIQLTSYKILMIQIFWVVFLLFIWFNTDAFIQYSKIMGLSKIFKIIDWEDYRLENGPKITYLEFIFLKNKNFFTKLITCKPCLNFWLTLIICLIFNSLELFPVIYMLSYIIYKIIDRYV
jgi:hypothetical protein